MKNEHLVPVNVADIVNRLSGKDLSENERMNLVLRLEAIRDFAAAAVAKHSRGPVLVQSKK
jgi:hypothetical protein